MTGLTFLKLFLTFWRTYFSRFCPSHNFVKGDASQTQTNYKGANKKVLK